MTETLEQFVARINKSAFIPPPTPTSRVGGERNMAKSVKLKKGQEFNFGAAKGQASKYPWDEWFNGDLLLLERSSGTEDDKGTVVEVTDKRDFEVQRDAMPAKIKTAARRRYKVVEISKRDADGQPLDNSGLIIRARDMSDDERQAEDLLRAEEKEAARERREQKKAQNQATDDNDDQESEAA